MKHISPTPLELLAERCKELASLAEGRLHEIAFLQTSLNIREDELFIQTRVNKQLEREIAILRASARIVPGDTETGKVGV